MTKTTPKKTKNTPKKAKKFDTKAFKALKKDLELHEDIEAWTEELQSHLASAEEEIKRLVKSSEKNEIYVPDVAIIKLRFKGLMQVTDALYKKVSLATEKKQNAVDKMEDDQPRKPYCVPHPLAGTFSF